MRYLTSFVHCLLLVAVIILLSGCEPEHTDQTVSLGPASSNNTSAPPVPVTNTTINRRAPVPSSSNMEKAATESEAKSSTDDPVMDMQVEEEPADPSLEGRTAGDELTLTEYKLDFHWCPPGIFLMGSPKSEAGRNSDETQSKVRLSSGFWMGETEVTQKTWYQVMGTKPWEERGELPEGDRIPAIRISFAEAEQFCEKLTTQEKKAGRIPENAQFRLPTEAEWEYACRSGSTTPHSFKPEDEQDQAGTADPEKDSEASRFAVFTEPPLTESPEQPQEVSQKNPSPWGFYDMHGNVAEWCQDRYDSRLAGGDDPLVSSGGNERVIRGGDYSSRLGGVRSAARSSKLPTAKGGQIGFRIVMVTGSPSESTNSDIMVATPTEDPGTAPDQFRGDSAGQGRTFSELGMKMRWCPPGTFTMGSPRDEKDRKINEAQVQVELPGGFWMKETEVTQREWQLVMTSTPWITHGDTENADFPVTRVGWQDAVDFCERLTENERNRGNLPPTGRYRLPTEAEWEYACRANTKTRFSFANDDSYAALADFALYRTEGEEAPESPSVVGKRSFNPWDIYDLHGNVSEWCLDWYADEYKGGVNPPGPLEGSERIIRGGSWTDRPQALRSACRAKLHPVSKQKDVGFRVVLVFE